MPLADELSVPPFCTVGAQVRAVGWHGGAKVFLATVRAIRQRFPRIVVEYTADEHGVAHPLALPTPRVAYVHGGMVSAS